MSEAQQRHRHSRINLGCGPDQPDDWCNVDIDASQSPDVVQDLTQTPWPFADSCAEEIQAHHVLEHLDHDDTVAALEECARILAPGGRLHIRVPVGLDADADPDHVSRWTWRTPLMYCGERPWDADVGLRVVDRDVDLEVVGSGPVLGALRKWVDWRLDRHGPGRWCFGLPSTVGVFEVRMEVDR